MKKLVIAATSGLFVGAAISWFLLAQRQPAPAGEAGANSASPPVRDHADGEVTLDLETQKRSGLAVAALEASSLPPEVTAFGQVVDPSTLAALVAERAAARAALAVSGKELQRLKVLYGQEQNVSARALEAAQAAQSRDQAAVEAVELRLKAAWGEVLADDAALLHELSSGTAVVKVALPLGSDMPGKPTAARLASVDAPDRILEAQVVGPTPGIDPQLQGRGFFLSLKNGGLPAGTAVTAWLSFAGEAKAGLLVPRPALVRHAGRAFVYVQTAPDRFARRALELGRPTDAGWLAQGEVHPGDKVVIAGAQQLLSEEKKGQGEEE